MVHVVLNEPAPVAHKQFAVSKLELIYTRSCNLSIFHFTGLPGFQAPMSRIEKGKGMLVSDTMRIRPQSPCARAHLKPTFSPSTTTIPPASLPHNYRHLKESPFVSHSKHHSLLGYTRCFGVAQGVDVSFKILEFLLVNRQ